MISQDNNSSHWHKTGAEMKGDRGRDVVGQGQRCRGTGAEMKGDRGRDVGGQGQRCRGTGAEI